MFVDEEAIAVEAGVLGWARSHIGRQHVPTGHIAATDVANEPVMPLTVLGFSTAWCIWVWSTLRVRMGTCCRDSPIQIPVVLCEHL